FLADRRVRGELDDALVILRDLQLARRAQHAAALDPADLADFEIEAGARNVRAGRREYALHAGARIARAAHDLHRRALSRVDHAYLQPVGVWMFFRRDDPRDGEWGELFGLVLDALDLEPAHGEAIDDRFERRLRFEMLLEPAEGEFHHDADCARRIV